MRYYLRFEVYDGPARRSITSIHPDVAIDEDLKGLQCGDPVRVGSDDDDPAAWPQYVVAHIPLAKEIVDPERPGKKALLWRIFLARFEQWEQFNLPEDLRKLWEKQQQTQ